MVDGKKRQVKSKIILKKKGNESQKENRITYFILLFMFKLISDDFADCSFSFWTVSLIKINKLAIWEEE